MLVLLTHPEEQPNEAVQLNAMLSHFPNFFLHLRKPAWSKEKHEKLISRLNPDFYQRIVIHQHLFLAEKFPLKGVHFTEHARKNNETANKLISTSFHHLAEAKAEGDKFEYYFCSPVFSSVSKQGHHPYETWDLTQADKIMQKKAVALGGINSETLEKTKLLGFKNAAFLGAVWGSKNTYEAFRRLYEKWEESV